MGGVGPGLEVGLGLGLWGKARARAMVRGRSRNKARGRARLFSALFVVVSGSFRFRSGLLSEAIWLGSDEILEPPSDWDRNG